MSLKKIEQVKKDRGFKLFDIIIYGAVLLIVAALFIAVFTTRNTDPLTGVKVTYKAQVVLEYEFGSGIKSVSDQVELEENDGGLTLTIRSNGDYNVIYIDKSKKTVKMKDANCRGKQCLYFAEIKNNSGFIVCEPHGVKVEPLISNFDFIQ